jgi:hypothetical protein
MIPSRILIPRTFEARIGAYLADKTHHLARRAGRAGPQPDATVPGPAPCCKTPRRSVANNGDASIIGIFSAPARALAVEPNRLSFVELPNTWQGLGQKPMVGTTRSIRYATQLAAAGCLALTFVSSPVRAVTCDEVRALSATELSDWAKRLKVSRGDLILLFEQSFCQLKKPSGVIVSARKANGFARKSKFS